MLQSSDTLQPVEYNTSIIALSLSDSAALRTISNSFWLRAFRGFLLYLIGFILAAGFIDKYPSDAHYLKKVLIIVLIISNVRLDILRSF